MAVEEGATQPSSKGERRRFGASEKRCRRFRWEGSGRYGRGGKVSNKNIKLKIYFQQNEVTQKQGEQKENITRKGGKFSSVQFESLHLCLILLICRGLVQVHLSKYQQMETYTIILAFCFRPYPPILSSATIFVCYHRAPSYIATIHAHVCMYVCMKELNKLFSLACISPYSIRICFHTYISFLLRIRM